MEIETAVMLGDATQALASFSHLDANGQRVIESLLSGAGSKVAAYVSVYGNTKSRTVATNDAWRFFDQPEVKLAIQELQALQRTQYAQMKDQIIQSLMADASYDIVEAFDSDTGAVRKMADIPVDVRQHITRYKELKDGVVIEFTDKLRAKQMLIDLLGVGQGTSAGMTINFNLGDEAEKEVEVIVVEGQEGAMELQLGTS